MTVERKYARVPEWCMGIVTNNCWDGITETERAQWNVFQVEIKTKFGESATIRLTLEEDNEIELFFFPENHVDDLAGNCCTVDILHNGLKEFTIYVDTLIQMWERETFTVHASTSEGAQKIAMDAINQGDIYLDFDAVCEPLHDTMERIDPEDNNGFATVTFAVDDPDVGVFFDNKPKRTS